MARAPEEGRAGRPPHRHRLRHLLRAVRARHQRVLGLGPADHSGLRPGDRAGDAGRRAGGARRRAFARPGHGDDARAGRARDHRHRHRQHPRGARRHRAHALLHRHLCVALDRDGGRRGGQRLQGAAAAFRHHRRASDAMRGQHRALRERRRSSGRSARSRCATSRRPGICGRTGCRPTSISAGSKPRSASSRRSTAAPSATPRMPRRSRSIPRSATSKSSTT